MRQKFPFEKTFDLSVYCSIFMIGEAKNTISDSKQNGKWRKTLRNIHDRTNYSITLATSTRVPSLSINQVNLFAMKVSLHLIGASIKIFSLLHKKSQIKIGNGGEKRKDVICVCLCLRIHLFLHVEINVRDY